MINWVFKDKILFEGEVINADSRKFEILVYHYLKQQYPLENWKLTKATRDGNRDLENICEFSGTTMWAEVKFTKHTDENIPSRKYDSTLVSSIFEKELIKIFFVSNTSIGNHLIDRVKRFYCLSTIKKIAFIDGYTLAYWTKKNPEVENFFFKEPLKLSIPTEPVVNLKCVRVFCKSDSYTIDSVLQDEFMYPLYISSNYILEGEFIAYGFDNKTLQLYCNDKLLFNETVYPEITTFSIDIGKQQNVFAINKEYSLDIYYILNSKKIECGTYKLHFAVLGRLYVNQIEAYSQIEKGLKEHYKNIYNIYGPKSSGKSWLMNNLKNDLLKNIKPNQKVIYINFTGQLSDVAYICRILFTLFFDFYNIEASASEFIDYCNKNNIANTFFSYKNIKYLIDALQEEDYITTQNILSGALLSKEPHVFRAKNEFRFDRFYFIDNIHLLSKTNHSFLEVFIKSFNPLGNVVFVLSGREKINFLNVKNILLNYISNEEILNTINENLPFKIYNLNEIVPNKHYLYCPGLLYSFNQQICNFKSIIEVKNYYFDIFLNNTLQYLKGDFLFDNVIIIVICIVKDGIPFKLFEGEDFDVLIKLIKRGYVIQREGMVYPNFEKWNKIIPAFALKDYKKNIVFYMEQFIKQDTERKELYECALMDYYTEYYNKFFPHIFKKIKDLFQKNKYGKVIVLCESILKGAEFFSGDLIKIEHIRYYLGFSYMHCDVSQKSQKIFENITDGYSLKIKDELYFNAKSEIIDAKYWGFKSYKTLAQYINNFRKEWKKAEKIFH